MTIQATFTTVSQVSSALPTPQSSRQPHYSPELFDLYYAEKCDVLPGGPLHPTRTTNEYRVLASVSREETEGYIRRFSHYRSSWRVQQVAA